MLAALPGALPEGSTWSDPDGGTFGWARLPGGTDTAGLPTGALARDVAFVPGAPFFAGEPDRAALRLSSTTNPPERIAEALRRLAPSLGATPS